MPRLPLHSPLILLLCLTHLQSILAQYSAQYIGCANPSGLSFPFSPSNTNAAGCGTACRNARYAYSFQRTVSGAFSCSCARTEPISGSGGLTTASGGVTTCPQNSYLTQKTSTSYRFSTCKVDYVKIPSEPRTTVPTFAACFDECSNYRTAYIRPSNAARNVECACSNIPPDNTYATLGCGSGVVFVFDHPPESAASGLSRKRSRQEVLEEGEEGWFCPKGLEACKVPDVEGSWECLDTRSELESCGGCVHGQYGNTTVMAGQGKDCSVLPGIAEFSASCNDGNCVATLCDAGWEFVDGQCIESW